ncbi:MAG: hypothetical protein E5V90_01375 [Mesorhizobium sp.]|nr:MAG: hypothetical protein E5V90_01375 [Mesorhizobium sp.]
MPTALPQLLVGFNQTTMAALSMVIVAAIIGGFEDIGWEVLSSMRKAEFGQSILSGLVIALLAILIDRLTIGFAKAPETGPTRAMRWMTPRRLALSLAVALALAVVIRLAAPDATLLPETGLRTQMGAVNQWLLGLVRDYAWFFNGVRNAVLYCLLLPMRVGISGSATPAMWGFSLPPSALAVYVGMIGGHVASGLAGAGFRVSGWSRTPRERVGVTAFHGEGGLVPAVTGADLLVNLLPSNQHTRGILDGRLFGLLAPGAYVVNLGRGDHLDETALRQALDSGHIAGAWLDVFLQEPLPADHWAWAHESVRITPHCGGLPTPEGTAAAIAEAIKALDDP